MFPANPTHCQSELFGSQTLLSKGKQQKLKESKQAVFYELIFRQISEDEFAVLYSGRDSRPIDPVNTLAAALILKHRHSWSYKELFEHIEFRSGAPVVFYPRRRRPPTPLARLAGPAGRAQDAAGECGGHRGGR